MGQAAGDGVDEGSGDALLLALPDHPSAAGQARGAARDTLTRWHLPELIDVVVLAVSELVTNAVRHGRSPLAMTLRRDGTEVRVEVHDGDTGIPSSSAQAGLDAEGGRGLDIVRAISATTGFRSVPGNGKTAFATFAAGGHLRTRPERGTT